MTADIRNTVAGCLSLLAHSSLHSPQNTAPRNEAIIYPFPAWMTAR